MRIWIGIQNDGMLQQVEIWESIFKQAIQVSWKQINFVSQLIS